MNLGADEGIARETQEHVCCGRWHLGHLREGKQRPSSRGDREDRSGGEQEPKRNRGEPPAPNLEQGAGIGTEADGAENPNGGGIGELLAGDRGPRHEQHEPRDDSKADVKVTAVERDVEEAEAGVLLRIVGVGQGEQPGIWHLQQMRTTAGERRGVSLRQTGRGNGVEPVFREAGEPGL